MEDWKSEVREIARKAKIRKKEREEEERKWKREEDIRGEKVREWVRNAIFRPLEEAVSVLREEGFDEKVEWNE